MVSYKLAKLQDYGGDLRKRWYVDFYALRGDKLERRRVWIERKYTTARQRYKRAETISARVNDLLRNGYQLPTETKDKQERPGGVIEQFRAVLTDNARIFRADTIRTYNSNINKFEQFIGVEAIPESITPETIASYRRHLLRSGNSSRTINNNIFALKSLFNYILPAGAKNPCVGLKSLATTQADNIPLSDKENQRLSEHLQSQNPGLYWFTRFIYYAFIRRTELTKIRIQDVDFDRAQIRISGTVAKNKRSDVIPLHPNLMPYLYSVQHLPGHYYLFGRGLKPGPKPQAVKSINTLHQRAVKDCGLNSAAVTLYTWKDTGIVNAYLAGVDIVTLKNLVRHKSLDMLTIYLNSLGLLKQPIDKTW